MSTSFCFYKSRINSIALFLFPCSSKMYLVSGRCSSICWKWCNTIVLAMHYCSWERREAVLYHLPMLLLNTSFVKKCRTNKNQLKQVHRFLDLMNENFQHPMLNFQQILAANAPHVSKHQNLFIPIFIFL